MKPICVPCQRFFRPVGTGTPFLENMPARDDAPPGTAAPDAWKPYKLWMGDLYECRGCGARIIVGVAQKPMAEHFQKDFDEWMKDYEPKVIVNDC